MSQKTQAELTALKVQDLKNILQEHGLPVNGVKADLVSRILASQQSGGADNTSTAASTNAGTSADAAAASTPSASAPDKSEVAGTTAGDASSAAAPALPEATSKETEAERRAKRAARFGDAGDDDAAKKARQERFGTAGDAVDDKHVQALDSELSNKRIRTNENGASAKPQQKKGGDKQHKQQQQQQQQKGGHQTSKPRSEVRTISKPADAEEEERRRKRAERFGAKA